LQVRKARRAATQRLRHERPDFGLIEVFFEFGDGQLILVCRSLTSGSLRVQARLNPQMGRSKILLLAEPDSHRARQPRGRRSDCRQA